MPTSISHASGLVAGGGLCYQAGDGLPVYRFQALKEDPLLVHAVFTRLGGVSRPPYAALNLGYSVGDDPEAVERNHHRMYRALGIRREQSVTCHLTHGADALLVTAAQRGQVAGRGDVLITADPDTYLSMRFADCVPILLYHPVRRAVGLAHAGWRGTVQNVAGAAVAAMASRLGCLPENITAVVGPAIGPCCYEVSEEVIHAFKASFSNQDMALSGGEGRPLFSRRNGRHAHLDLWEANRRQLAAAGVGRIVEAGLCTACHLDHFFSHRAERGRTGRFGVVIGYRSG